MRALRTGNLITSLTHYKVLRMRRLVFDRTFSWYMCSRLYVYVLLPRGLYWNIFVPFSLASSRMTQKS